jgi:hypothetical protein
MSDVRPGVTGLRLTLTSEEAANLYNLVSDNPRPWNHDLRMVLKQEVSAREASNAVDADKQTKG